MKKIYVAIAVVLFAAAGVATESLIYLSPLECRIENGRYVPADFQGYPAYYVNKIEVYDWNGAYIKTYHTDNPFCSFYVSDDDRIIYTLSINEDLYSVIYRYDARFGNFEKDTENHTDGSCCSRICVGSL